MLQVHSTMNYHHTKPNNLTTWYSCLGLSDMGKVKENPIPALTWIHCYIHISLSMSVFPINHDFELVQANSKLKKTTKRLFTYRLVAPCQDLLEGQVPVLWHRSTQVIVLRPLHTQQRVVSRSKWYHTYFSLQWLCRNQRLVFLSVTGLSAKLYFPATIGKQKRDNRD